MWLSEGHKDMLSFISWNIDGFGSKLSTDYVVDNLCKYDFIALQETFTSNQSKDIEARMSMDGYECIYTHCVTNKSAGRGSGGILLLYKHKYHNAVTTCQTINPYTLWLKLSKDVFGWDNDIYICSVYIPPRDSPYFNDQFQDLENEVSLFSNKGDTLLMGDFNARPQTGGIPKLDYIKNDNDNFIPLPINYNSDIQIRDRTSEDSNSNTHGQKLIDLYISAELRILNGRTPGDYFGRYTCYHPAGNCIVDYFICNENLLHKVMYLNVKPLTASSIHCPITCMLKSKYQPKNVPKLQFTPASRRLKLKPELKGPYIERLTNKKSLKDIQDFMELELENFQTSINNGTNLLNSIITDAAIAVLPPCTRKQNHNKKNKTTKILRTNTNVQIKEYQNQF